MTAGRVIRGEIKVEDEEKTNGDKLKLKKTERLSLVKTGIRADRHGEVQAANRTYG